MISILPEDVLRVGKTWKENIEFSAIGQAITADMLDIMIFFYLPGGKKKNIYIYIYIYMYVCIYLIVVKYT